MATKILILVILSLSYLKIKNSFAFTNFSDIHNKHTRLKISKIKLNFIAKKIDTQQLYSNNIIVLNKDIELSHIYPNYEDRISTFQQMVDTLVIKNKRFCIQQLLNDTVSNIYPNIVQAYLVKQKEQNILCVEGLFMDDVEVSHKRWILFFDLTDIKNIIHIKSICNTRYATNTDFLGDFNNDGNIDVCLFNGDTINVFNIHNNTLVQSRKYYLVTERLGNEHIYCVNLNHSNWFYDLKSNNCGNKKKFEFHYIKTHNY